MRWNTRFGVSVIFAVLAGAAAGASLVRGQEQVETLAEPAERATEHRAPEAEPQRQEPSAQATNEEVRAEESPPAESEPRDTAARELLQRMYVEYLTSQGYEPRIDDDGDVEFEHDDLYVYILVDETDPEFFSMILPNVWSVETDEERQLARAGADAANARAKVAKVYTVEDTVWVSFEVFVAEPEDFKPFFARALRAMETALDGFLEHMPTPAQGEVGSRGQPSRPSGVRQGFAIPPAPMARRSPPPAASSAAPASPGSA